MFGYCVWLKLHDTHYYNILIKQITSKFKLVEHKAHITINYNIKMLDAFIIYFGNDIKHSFYPINKIYKSSNENFHSLQLDLSNNNNEIRKGTHHISLAYRTDRPFNEYEIQYANKLLKFTSIYRKDYMVNVYDCDSIYCNKWYEIL